jgi:hypothetical protein
MATKRRRLWAAKYRKELRAVADEVHDTGPHPLPTVDEIDAVLADLPDHGEVPASDEETTEAAQVAEGEAS